MYVVGGSQTEDRKGKPAWQQLGEGTILKISEDGARVEQCVDYVSPPDACASEDPQITFKAACVRDEKMYVCTNTEILVYDLPGFELDNYISHPYFNDVHHVSPFSNGNLAVVNTGLDMVMEMNGHGEILNLWNVLDRDPWEKFDPNTDYRKILSTKPHASHPNHVFHLNGDIWVTRFQQKDCVSLSDQNRRMRIDVQRPHDGLIWMDKVYFTTVNGCVVGHCQKTLKQTDLYDLNRFKSTDRPLGWCRGLAITEKNTFWVGFSRIRQTKFRENLRWVKHNLGLATTTNLPTRIEEYDMASGEPLNRIDLEQYGLNVVFSIHT